MLLTKTMTRTVIPRKTSIERTRGGLSAALGTPRILTTRFPGCGGTNTLPSNDV
jgi:hypothetical protein